MNSSKYPFLYEFDVVIVGAGPAGLGIGILLQKLGIDFVILERDAVGSSFRKWPKETRFISPSFTGNFFKMPDLNAITPDTSPAYTLLKEHPTGEDYAKYLVGISGHYALPVETGVEVQHIHTANGSFTLQTSGGEYRSTYVIWAAGEYQYPDLNNFTGAELCQHYSEVQSFAELDGEEHIVIGAYESGFDATVNLVLEEKKVTLLDNANYLELVNSDSSYSLSPFTRERIEQVVDQFDYYTDTRVISVEFEHGLYHVRTVDDQLFTSPQKPINCTGFTSSLKLVSPLFHFEEDYPVLNRVDESTRTQNLYLAGPQVKHDTALFCFIYKYRQRFAVVAESIAQREGISPLLIEDVLQEYVDNNFYLTDLSCCDDECVC